MGGQNSVTTTTTTTTTNNEQQTTTTNNTDDHNSPPGFFQNPWANNPYVKSALWEMIHLNFWLGYKAKELCCLCQAQEKNVITLFKNLQSF